MDNGTPRTRQTHLDLLRLIATIAIREGGRTVGSGVVIAINE